ncbi:MAG: formylglycine-generating enzyme family protein [Prevotellaceae bacterium]|nr:formylglycine-generating enzyme family protein [Prevotellaceae bacterium]
MIYLLALLLLAAQAQGAREPLAVLVVGVDSWLYGDVIAHIVGEELKRSNSNLVPVTREKFVQDKLKALRRASGEINLCELRTWANSRQLAQVCLVEAKAGDGYSTFSFSHDKQAYSAQVINVTSNSLSCPAAFDFNRSGGGEMAPAELTKVAWEVVGRLQSSCKVSQHRIKCFEGEPNMVFVGKGTFEMGCKEGRDLYCSVYSAVLRLHSVTLTKDFLISETEITQGEWRAVMGDEHFPHLNGDFIRGDSLPIYEMSEVNLQSYLNKLNELAGITVDSLKYRIPTEAEWEYAARGGHKQESFVFSGSDDFNEVATYPLGAVKRFKPNGLGIYDMTGNAAELCSDYYRSDYYQLEPPGGWINPECPPPPPNYKPAQGERWANYRINRGGFAGTDASECFRVVIRECSSFCTGIRLILPLP